MSRERIDCRTVTEIVPGNLYMHPNAETVGGCAEGCCDDYKCPDCGTTWRYEWPD